MANDDVLDRARQLLPLRDLPPEERARLGITRSGRSRPKAIVPAPLKREDTYLEDLDRLRKEAADADPVLSSMSDQMRQRRVMDETLRALATEAASIKFDRINAEREGRETVGQLCSRRVAALTQLASLVVERARVGGEPDFDPHDPKVQKVVAAFFHAMRECARETIDSSAVERFLARFEQLAKGWEDRVG